MAKENEWLECINGKGEKVFSFSKNIDEASSYSEKMAPEAFKGSHGHVDNTGPEYDKVNLDNL